MALVVNDRVRETSTTTGTGAMTLGGAEQSFITFAAGIGNSNETYYAISLRGGAEFETGRGTLNGSSTTLTRTEVFKSSNSDNAVSFSAGTKDIFCTLPASKAVFEDASSNVTVPADLTVADDLLVSGGVIDVKNTGAQSVVRFYCESSNAHYAEIKAPAHSAFSGNVSLTLPAVTDTLVGLAATQTITNKSIDSDNNTITNLVNADIKSSAAIAFSKMADLTASRALVSDGSGDVSVSAVTSTEVGYLDGVTSAIQTQIDTKTTAGFAVAMAIAL